MTFELHRHDARNISTLLEPDSVDLIVTSPPYFALRSYRDTCDACDGTGEAPDGTEARPNPARGGYGTGNLGEDRMRSSTLTGGKRKLLDLHKAGDQAQADATCPACNGTGRSHFDGQLGSEATPAEFVDNLIACTADWLRVLKPTGSLFVNLGDKYAGSGGHNNASLGNTPLYSKSTLTGGKRKLVAQETDRIEATRRNAPDRYIQESDGIRAKSLMGLPWRYALRCIDELGLILRAEIIWAKPNGLPESVTDRVRRSHEQWFHLVRSPRYFAAIDEVREEHHVGPNSHSFGPNGSRAAYLYEDTNDGDHQARNLHGRDYNPLGKVPGSVWSIPSEPLTVPDNLGVDHFAAFPSELPRRIILGWTPTGYCTACGEARRAVVDKGGLTDEGVALAESRSPSNLLRYEQGAGHGATTEAFRLRHSLSGPERQRLELPATITGYVCACPDTDAPTTPAVVLDPFAGTGTTVAVAHLLGRHGIGTDLSQDYLRLAEWRCTSDHALRDKVLARSDLPKAPTIDGQLDLFAEWTAANG